MKLLIIAAFASLISLTTFAQHHQNEHSVEVCSSVDTTVCAHIGHMKDLIPSKLGSFVVHVTGPLEASNMTVLLWMPSMGHGSSPVTVTQFDVNKYNITQAAFIMKGEWLVRLAFTTGDVANENQLVHQIDIPLEIK
jgi:hypothetical protein